MYRPRLGQGGEAPGGIGPALGGSCPSVPTASVLLVVFVSVQNIGHGRTTCHPGYPKSALFNRLLEVACEVLLKQVKPESNVIDVNLQDHLIG